MRSRSLLAITAVGLALGASGAVARHAIQGAPTRVPLRFLAAHSHPRRRGVSESQRPSSRPTPADDQSAVDAYFEASSSYWNDIYRLDDVTSLIVQQRGQLALSWVDRLGLPPGSSVLEVGCGAGLTALALARRGLRVYATDSVPAMLDLARARVAAAGVSHLVEVRKSDVHALDFEDAQFDLVVALGVIPWLHSPSDALHEMARVLKPGRALIASANNLARLHYLCDPKLSPHLGGARRAVKRVLRMRSRSRSGVPGFNLHSCEEFDRLLSSACLIKEEGRALGFGPFTFLGRGILPQRIGVDVHNRLQRLADRGVPGIASRGAQYMVLARKERVGSKEVPMMRDVA
jgi:ubiquinone/menaquinone biosynthesis C-methylase UbiE